MGLRSVSEALLKIKKPFLIEYHNLEDYAQAFTQFKRRVTKTIGGGSDCIVLLLEDGNVLKITTREFPDNFGNRSFDMPVLEKGSRDVDGVRINYFIQPLATRSYPRDLTAVGKMINDAGFHFEEPFLNQVGVYDGGAYLLDPWAVVPLS